MSFDSLGLSAPILQAIAEKGYTKPSPIQLKAIPAVIEGRDIMATAQTGTGKTAGFTLPLLERLSKGQRLNKSNQVRALVLTPTRELAAQVGESIATYGRHLPLSSMVVFGGVKINPQMMRLRRGADILVATPGRLLDLYGQNAVRFKHLEVLVLDEADRMLDMGFIHDIRKILNILPKQRQNLMFSATFSDEIRQLAKGLVKNPIEISIGARNTTVKSVKQLVHPVDKKQKPALLANLIEENNWQQVLVFARTKHGSNKLASFLEKRDIKTAAIHGNKSQGARTKALDDFKKGEIRVLVATDIASRGLDIDQLPQVVNFDLPNVPEDYVHRIGRTGRASCRGNAISLVCADEYKQLCDIERLINKLLPREYVDDFIPVHNVPESSEMHLNKQKKKPKKPKKSKVGHWDGQRSGEVASGHKAGGAQKTGTGKRPAKSKSAAGKAYAGKSSIGKPSAKSGKNKTSTQGAKQSKPLKGGFANSSNAKSVNSKVWGKKSAPKM